MRPSWDETRYQERITDLEAKVKDGEACYCRLVEILDASKSRKIDGKYWIVIPTSVFRNAMATYGEIEMRGMDEDELPSGLTED